MVIGIIGSEEYRANSGSMMISFSIIYQQTNYEGCFYFGYGCYFSSVPNIVQSAFKIIGLMRPILALGLDMVRGDNPLRENN